jgi:aspartate/methionine/tyrosine aminotransferase
MQLNPFHLDEWLEEHEHDARYNLAASTGPTWTVDELLRLMDDEQKQRFFHAPLTYCPGNGHDSLRQELASMLGVPFEEIQVVTGASEALHAFYFLAAEPGANVVVPRVSFPPFLDIPKAFGIELRSYDQRHDDGFRIDVDAIEALCDANTKLVLLNSPHNPTGATIDEKDLVRLGNFCGSKGIQLVADEVYHPIYHDEPNRSAVDLVNCTLMGDFSKAFSLPGLRLGFIHDRNPKRRNDYWNVRAHFTISNNMPGEFLAEVAVAHRETIFERTRGVASKNLALLDELFREHSDVVEWVRPRGGLTAFPRLRHADSARPFCEAAAAEGVVLVPGDCFGVREHFRLGFGACSEGFDHAVEILSEVLVRHGQPVRQSES